MVSPNRRGPNILIWCTKKHEIHTCQTFVYTLHLDVQKLSFLIEIKYSERFKVGKRFKDQLFILKFPLKGKQIVVI